MPSLSSFDLMATSTSTHNTQHKMAAPTPPNPNSLAALTSSRSDGKTHLLLAASGSVATIKIPPILAALSPYAATLSVRLILTSSAQHFLAGQADEQPPWSSLSAIPGVDAVYSDDSEWGEPWTRGRSILHIELRRWADVLVVAPLSANTLAKVVSGICDNLLTSVVRAWDTDGRVDGTRKRILVAPAMNVSFPEFIFFGLPPASGHGEVFANPGPCYLDGHVASPCDGQADPGAG